MSRRVGDLFSLEEIQTLSDEQLLNELMSISYKFLSVADTVESNALFYQLKDMKREVLFRMYHGSRGEPTVFEDEDGDSRSAQ